MSNDRDQRPAFTLIEVLVSLAIFAVAAVALSAAYLNVLNGYQTRDRQREIIHGWKLTRVMVMTEPDRATLEDGGKLNLPDNVNLSWEVKIEPTELADLFAMELSVTARSTTEWSKTEWLMVFRPAWSDPAERDRLRQESSQRVERSRNP